MTRLWPPTTPWPEQRSMGGWSLSEGATRTLVSLPSLAIEVFVPTSESSLVDVPAGGITLHDRGSQKNWRVEVLAFCLAPHPVTRSLYASVRGQVLAGRPRTPVTDVSWLDAVRFCNRLSESAGLVPCYSVGDDPDGLDVVWDRSADGYRLPSEAEWEHACRSVSTGVGPEDLDVIAWHRGNSEGGPQEVGLLEANTWGLYDTLGNVWEWCWDLYDPRVYGPYRVFRGGGWNDLPHACRASVRRKSHPALRVDDLGFRLARTPRPSST